MDQLAESSSNWANEAHKFVQTQKRNAVMGGEFFALLCSAILSFSFFFFFNVFASLYRLYLFLNAALVGYDTLISHMLTFDGDHN